MSIKPNPEDKSILNPDFITGLTEAEVHFLLIRL
jgi:hypothetical protein